MSFNDYLSKKVEVPLEERTQEERDAEWKAIKLEIYKESKKVNAAISHFADLVGKYPTLDHEFAAYKKYYPFKQGPTGLSSAVQDWVSEMEDEAKS